MHKIKTALVSVSDKSNLDQLAQVFNKKKYKSYFYRWNIQSIKRVWCEAACSSI